MTSDKAKTILLGRGHDTIGAEEIISQCEDDGLLAQMEDEDLIRLAEDYEHR